MRCNKVKRHLFNYVNNELDNELEKEIHNHLKICQKCQKEALSLQKYIKYIKKASTIKTSDDFLDRLHAKLDKQKTISYPERLKQWIVLYRKIITPVAAVSFSIIFISIFVFQNHETDFAITEKFKNSQSIANKTIIDKTKKSRTKNSVDNKKKHSIKSNINNLQTDNDDLQGFHALNEKESSEKDIYIISLNESDEFTLDQDSDLDTLNDKQNNVFKKIKYLTKRYKGIIKETNKTSYVFLEISSKNYNNFTNSLYKIKRIQKTPVLKKYNEPTKIYLKINF